MSGCIPDPRLGSEPQSEAIPSCKAISYGATGGFIFVDFLLQNRTKEKGLFEAHCVVVFNANYWLTSDFRRYCAHISGTNTHNVIDLDDVELLKRVKKGHAKFVDLQREISGPRSDLILAA
jgi:hypothetical protein